MKIGIDLGGTKTEGILITERGEVKQTLRKPTPQKHGYEAILDNVADIVSQLEKQAGQQCSVGIGTPGSIIKETGLLKYSNSVCLNDQPLKRDLALLLKREVRVENDANCFALSEAIDGAGKNHNVVFGIIMGTGVGGGIIVNNKILKGPNGMTGEWGHTTFDRSGESCFCGLAGCIEKYLSGPGLIEQYQINSGNAVKRVEEIVLKANQDESAALTTLDEFHEHFAQSISTIIKILDPDMIVLGGGLSNLKSLYHQRERIAGYFSNPIKVNLAKNKFGDSSGVRGAAALW